MAFPKLHPFYYRDHFLEMLSFLERNGWELMEDGHRQFVEGFRELDGKSQAVLVRMINRKGECFRITSLAYEEIGDPRGPLEELMDRGWVRPAFRADLPVLLERLTKEELLEVMEGAGIPLKGRRSLAKGKLLEICATGEQVDQLFAELDPGEWVILAVSECVGYLAFLYFGYQAEDLTVFTMRDLGLLQRGKTPSAARIEPAFRDLDSARNAYFYSRLRERMKNGDRVEWLEFAGQIDSWPRRSGGEDDLHFSRAVTRLGKLLESSGEVDSAISVFGRSDSFPAIERLCRLRFAAGHREEVKALLEGVIADPSCDEAQIFAEDFYARKFGGQRLGALTALLREAPVVEVDESFRGQAEMGVVERFVADGYRAYWTENVFWRTLFVSVFWEELFGEDGAGVPNEFAQLPLCLRDGSFYSRFSEGIEAKLSSLGSGDFCLPERTVDLPVGGGWSPSVAEDVSRELVDEFLRKVPGVVVGSILRRMAMDFAACSSGFPDLLVFEDGGVKGVEVKAEGDSIRRNQLAQMRRLREEGFPVEVVRARWCRDPDQLYTVVDVETTGGAPGRHRLTEVAAVKVRRGQIVDRYQTLLNPERAIPRQICQLTGITDEMVSGSPRFSEVGESLHRFLSEGVLVAHNAKFDFGFLRSEFSRVGLDFKRPILCTVVEARRMFPGLPSYGLANLARYFGVPLTRHHRAMADVEATVEILQRILEKRFEAVS
ncbi:MAG: exonuclease domain-containing protein [Puniceicoccales bacterium]